VWTVGSRRPYSPLVVRYRTSADSHTASYECTHTHTHTHTHPEFRHVIVRINHSNFIHVKSHCSGCKKPPTRANRSNALIDYILLWPVERVVPICLNTNYNLNCTNFGKMTLRKIIKIAANTCHILKLKCTKFDIGAYSAPQTP